MTGSAYALQIRGKALPLPCWYVSLEEARLNRNALNPALYGNLIVDIVRVEWTVIEEQPVPAVGGENRP